MYYHARQIQYVTYGKVGPPPLETLDPNFALAYRWLGQYCEFHPQVWLSRSTSGITGFRFPNLLKRTPKSPPSDKVLFGFETIQGFPVNYDFWCELLCTLMNSKSLDHANTRIQEDIAERSVDPDPEMYEDPISVTWRKTHDVRAVLSEHLFVKHNQMVVPQLNLKAAKVIICRNEHQKKTLRRMGFIEDRLVIRGHRNKTGWRRFARKGENDDEP